MKKLNIDPKNTKMDLSVRVARHIFYTFEHEYGMDELEKLFERTGIPPVYFENENNWISFEYFCNLLNELVNYTRDPRVAYKYGLNSANKYAESWGSLLKLFTIFPLPYLSYKIIFYTFDRWSKCGKFIFLDYKINKAVLQFRMRDDIKQDKNNCLNIQGQIASIPTFYNLPPAKITETQCAAEGADSCIYEINWKNYSYKRIKFFSLLIGIISVLIFYLLFRWQIITLDTISNIILVLIPVSFYYFGRLFDYKKTFIDNLKIMDEQSAAAISSLLSIDKLNEDLQKTVRERTEELRISNDELRKTVAELTKSKEQLIQSEKLASIGHLAAGVAHELNNPLGAVRNYLQDILEDIPNEDPLRRYIFKAEKATGQCKTIVNDLLSFSRVNENLSLVELDISNIIENTLANIKKSFTYLNIKIINDIKMDLPKVKVDSMQIHQVFMNIIMNAHDSIKGEGRILIKARAKDNRIHVDITDTGEGVPENIFDIISDPSVMIQKEDKMKNLRLAISYNIIRRFNGDIKVKSETGKGATFSVTIPCN